MVLRTFSVLVVGLLLAGCPPSNVGDDPGGGGLDARPEDPGEGMTATLHDEQGDVVGRATFVQEPSGMMLSAKVEGLRGAPDVVALGPLADCPVGNMEGADDQPLLGPEVAPTPAQQKDQEVGGTPITADQTGQTSPSGRPTSGLVEPAPPVDAPTRAAARAGGTEALEVQELGQGRFGAVLTEEQAESLAGHALIVRAGDETWCGAVRPQT